VIGVFQQVLNSDFRGVVCGKQIAAFEFGIRKPDDARARQRKMLAEDQKASVAACATGVID
jgi:hypothetical protein